MNDGGPAFPVLENIFAKSASGDFAEKVGETHHQGMSVRDYFAAKAMQGLVQNMKSYDESLRQWVAIKGYEIADAMIAEREKK